ncbi:hypothetical protein C0995_005411 [Termitomyces sp. Mi166|nr:hypothetical protein C0995_005411 [Termitomyces sp. Mi166\
MVVAAKAYLAAKGLLMAYYQLKGGKKAKASQCTAHLNLLQALPSPRPPASTSVSKPTVVITRPSLAVLKPKKKMPVLWEVTAEADGSEEESESEEVTQPAEELQWLTEARDKGNQEGAELLRPTP